MTAPLEDNFADIVSKARRGLCLPGGRLPSLEANIRRLAALRVG